MHPFNFHYKLFYVVTLISLILSILIILWADKLSFCAYMFLKVLGINIFKMSALNLIQITAKENIFYFFALHKRKEIKFMISPILSLLSW